LCPQAIAETRAITISNIACRTRSGSRRSGIASASHRHTPSPRSASRSPDRHRRTGCRHQGSNIATCITGDDTKRFIDRHVADPANPTPVRASPVDLIDSLTPDFEKRPESPERIETPAPRAPRGLGSERGPGGSCRVAIPDRSHLQLPTADAPDCSGIAQACRNTSSPWWQAFRWAAP
jgi:hypothetical protein